MGPHSMAHTWKKRTHLLPQAVLTTAKMNKACVTGRLAMPIPTERLPWANRNIPVLSLNATGQGPDRRFGIGALLRRLISRATPCAAGQARFPSRCEASNDAPPDRA